MVIIYYRVKSDKKKSRAIKIRYRVGRSDTTKLIRGLTHLPRGLKSSRRMFRVPDLLVMMI